jgi:hypothetical protein
MLSLYSSERVRSASVLAAWYERVLKSLLIGGAGSSVWT